MVFLCVVCSRISSLQYCFLGKKTEYFFTQKLLKTTSVKRKQDLILDCMLSDPRPSVTWTKNGEKIEVKSTYFEFKFLREQTTIGLFCFLLLFIN